MAKKKTISKRHVEPQSPTVPDPVITILNRIYEQLRHGTDPRRRRFCLALLMALPRLTADQMDKIEPTLWAAIGGGTVQEQHMQLEAILEAARNENRHRLEDIVEER